MLFSRYTNDEDGKLELNLLMQTNLNRIRRLGLVSVSLIEGFAIGGGAEVSTSTDFRVMTNSEKSYIRFIHHRLSLCPGWGGGSRLVQIIGRNQAPKAYELGIVDDILTGDPMKGAKAFLDLYTDYNVNSTRAIKSLVASSVDGG